MVSMNTVGLTVQRTSCGFLLTVKIFRKCVTANCEVFSFLSICVDEHKGRLAPWMSFGGYFYQHVEGENSLTSPV